MIVLPVKKVALLCVLSFLVAINVSAQQPVLEKLQNGITINFSAPNDEGVNKLSLYVINDNIIRVVATPLNGSETSKSLMLQDNLPNNKNSNWNVTNNENEVVVRTAAIQVQISLKTGKVIFKDISGNILLQEKDNSRHFRRVIYEGQPLYETRQAFTLKDDEATYGLGQHQSDVMDYRGQQVFLWQNNTEVAVPLLVSSNNYGILWDNNSLTTAGDVRPLMPLSALKLYSKEGDNGWLTATYGHHNSPFKQFAVRAESEIDYTFLNDIKKAPEGFFTHNNGIVTWEGAVESGITGLHQFHVKSAGYVKIWVNNQLLLNRWRQPWNPGDVLMPLQMEKGVKYNIKIEWQPDGNDSYLSVKWQAPVPDAQKNDFAFVSNAGKKIDYYFINGKNLDEVISGYRLLTGKAIMLPKWAWGLWQSRERYKTQKELLDVVTEFRKRKIPLDNIVQDWSYWKQDDWGSQQFDSSRFPDATGMIKTLHAENTHFMISVWPKFYEGIPAYKQFDANGWLYKRNVADRQRDWIAQGYVSTFYDAFNADARKGFWDLLNKNLYSKGVDAWWMDASEPDILSNVSPEKRIEQMQPTAAGPSAEYLNAYPLENAKGIYEGQRGTDPGKRSFILTRSGFAGSQRYGAVIWSGDIAARWHDMKDQIAAGLNFSLSGLPYWSMDIGGFAVEKRYEHAQGEDLEEWREQMTRWYQFGAFCPLFRVHGQFPYREIYNVAPETHPAYKSMLYYDHLRYRLMPYIYSFAGKIYQDDYTPMRALVMDFNNDPKVKNIGDQFMFGPSLLVSPVLEYKATSRSVYLPQGNGWYNFYTGKYDDGGQTINADAPYERVPLFVREGSIVPVGPELQFTSEKTASVITLYVYTGKDGKFSLYEDDGLKYDYEKGAFANIPITYNEAEGTLTIGERSGSFDGMLKKRTFNIKWINKKNAQAFDADSKGDESVTYSGKKIVIKSRK
ncbi:TIM-barrel domain-containing protein [Pinibacter soli]|uniref:Glycoside hydrolase family 31 protein n=1 Tax=Pinibacter soli TaxID=3044211 RepID=A0ABT6RJ07_9BACT|nr:TIM-barrel domain-containing protein [Pinibacter soli]MDI3321827.1 glycoside hydrolase family 31 protein [Pinibacter soli]